MGADAAFEAVQDRAQQQLRLEVAEAAFGLQEVLVPEGGVVAQCALGAQVGGLVAVTGLVAGWTCGVAGAVLGDAGKFGLDAGDCVVALLRVALLLFRLWQMTNRASLPSTRASLTRRLSLTCW